MEKVAWAFGIETSFSHSSFDSSIEAERVAEAARMRPDLLVIVAASAEGGARSASIAYRAGVPTIYANTIPDPECFRYCLAWTGPDDWAQTRAIARRFAERLGGKGGYAIVQHVPGSSAFYSRTYALVTELAKVAPEMRLLEAAHSRFDRADTAELVGKGVLDSITYQPPEGDGALAMKAAVDWFSALALSPMIYLPYDIVTKDNLDSFLPAQW
jgi:ribose transport system substrate-binding protein